MSGFELGLGVAAGMLFLPIAIYIAFFILGACFSILAWVFRGFK